MTHGSRPPMALALPAIAGALMLLAQAASAQGEPAKTQEMERAQKAADAVFHWIKLNGDKGASRQPTTPAPTPAPPPPPAQAARKPAPVAAAPKPAPAPAAATAAPAATPVQAQATQPQPQPQPDPAPVAVATAALTEPAPEPVVLALAAPSPPPDAPLAAAANALPPAPEPEEEAEVPLKLLAKVDPAIPRQLQQQSFRNGFAQVQFTVQPDGSVSQAKALKTSHSRLGTAAVDAVRQWRFAPIPKAREAAVEVAFKSGEE